MAKATGGKSARRPKRREELRRNLPKPTIDFLAVLKRPDLIKSSLLLLAFAVIAGLIVDWSREQVLVLDGQVMTETRVWRFDFSYEDENATRALRTQARDSSPDLYRYTPQELTLSDEIAGLPTAVADKPLSEINTNIQAAFDLDEAALAALQGYAQDGKPTHQWQQAANRLVDKLRYRPLIGSSDFQKFAMNKNRAIYEINGDTSPMPYRILPIELNKDDPKGVRTQLESLVIEAAFPDTVIRHIASRLYDKPTMEYLPQQTAELAEASADGVDRMVIARSRGDVIYRRGDQLSTQQYAEACRETLEHANLSGLAVSWLPAFGIVGLCTIITVLLGLFFSRGYPRLLRNGWRLIALCALSIGMLAVSVATTRHAPAFLGAATIAPTLLLTVVVLLVYDQRLATVIAALQAALVTMALQQTVGWFLVVLLGCSAMIAQLPEVRHRNSLIRAAVGTAVVIAAGSVFFGVLETPIVEGAWRQILVNAAWTASCSFAVGFLVLGILPSIERLFGVTTGMTLAELRDPRQPLLRQLQLRAAGTYNHSLQVANISEAAAESIGADGLLVYVGALYHDIGKVNKPEYFVENTSGGDNKHDKLSPAMSLLVIIGHVKDGIELAAEYGLPRQLVHIIESHHGTTLVEYFYHAAMEQASGDAKATVKEVAFRYPGPKPRTREAAIVMLADAVESATRAMAEPNPARIESLVRAISRKRMTDGQFDQCPLTFRDLGLIEEAMIGRLCAIHHGRISYPSRAEGPDVTTADESPRSKASA